LAGTGGAKTWQERQQDFAALAADVILAEAAPYHPAIALLRCLHQIVGSYF
jgi:hypothetical protein